MKIDRCVCFVLDKRYENWSTIQQSCKEVGIEPQLHLAGDGKLLNLPYDYIDEDEIPPRLSLSTYYPTWWTPQCYNMYKCQKNVLEKALKDKINTLLLLEDDIIIEEDFVETWNSVSDFFEQNYWDAIYFGSYHLPGSTVEITPNVLKLSTTGGLHACLMKSNIIREILDYGPISPMDEIMSKYIQKTNQCYAIYPSIISQKSGYSHIEKGNLEKPSRYHK